MYNYHLYSQFTEVDWNKTKKEESLNRYLKMQYHMAFLRMVFDDLNTAVEALEVLHCLFLNLNRTDWWGCINLRFEPAVWPSGVWWWALTCGNWESSCFYLWAVGKSLQFFTLHHDKRGNNCQQEYNEKTLNLIN